MCVIDCAECFHYVGDIAAKEVLEVCKANGLTYYYGADKMAYTSCFLLKD